MFLSEFSLKNGAAVLVWAGLTFSSFSSFSQKLSAGTPESAGMSSERLKRVDRILQSFVDEERVAGAIGFVARNGKIVYHKSFGYNDLEARTPLSKDAIVRIASQTKAITSAAIMLLYEEGHFLLDDPVSRYLPSFAHPKVLETFNPGDSTYTARPAKREITIRDLLTHTSGIGYAVIGTKEANAIYAKHNIPVGLEGPSASLKEVMERLGGLPLFHEPGTRYLYGLNSDVLGYLVEVISGKTLADFFRERLFKPLGMDDTYFNLPLQKQERLAVLYTENADRKTVKVSDHGSPLAKDGKMLENYPRSNGTYFSGGAGLSSTAYDYAMFLQMLLNRGRYNGHQIMSPTTVKMFTANQIGHLTEGKNNFSLGFGITTEAQALKLPMAAGTFDWGGAFGTQYWVDPVEGIVGVVITQKQPSSWGGELSGKFKAAVYQAITQSNQPH
ncbi:serine hydrolase domain-containing protein [Ravibacter arvi]|uniref:Serine hydrolase domain-containing protein n=1 Tax=Ravibacter arvi TaxID=2051041 RepID=A0ABP8LMP5_9BACT